MRLGNPVNVHKRLLMHEELPMRYFGSLGRLEESKPGLVKISKPNEVERIKKNFNYHPDILDFNCFYLDIATKRIYGTERRHKTSPVWMIRTT